MNEEKRDRKLNRTQTQAALRRRPSVGFLDLRRLSMSYWPSHATSFFIQLFGPPKNDSAQTGQRFKSSALKLAGNSSRIRIETKLPSDRKITRASSIANSANT